MDTKWYVLKINSVKLVGPFDTENAAKEYAVASVFDEPWVVRPLEDARQWTATYPMEIIAPRVRTALERYRERYSYAPWECVNGPTSEWAEQIAEYVMTGKPLESPYLRAVFTNSLWGTVDSVGTLSVRSLMDLRRFLNAAVPCGAQGGVSDYTKWCNNGGLEGKGSR